MGSFTTSLRELVSRRPTIAELQLGNKIVGPDFICFGMQKAGTRWLFDQMNARPDVWMPPIKELNFFTGTSLKDSNLKIINKYEKLARYLCWDDQEMRFRRKLFVENFSTFNNKSGIGWYKNLFLLKGDRISGDISPNYGKINSEQISCCHERIDGYALHFLDQGTSRPVVVRRVDVCSAAASVCSADHRLGNAEADAFKGWSRGQLVSFPHLDAMVGRDTCRPHSVLVFRRHSSRAGEGGR